jgi:lysophospholipase L1-like esterase
MSIGEFMRNAAITGLKGGASRAASGIVSHRPAGGIVSSSTIQPAGETYSSIISCSKDFMGIRILFENYDTAASKTIKAKAAPTATITAGGSTLAFLPVTFNGVDNVTLPPATSIRGLTAYAQITPSYAWSDVIPIQSIPRTDVIGADRLVYLRTYSAQALCPKVLYVTENSVINQGWLDTGDYVASSSITGDYVTTTTTNIVPSIYKTGDATVPAYSAAFMPYAQIDFYTGGKTARILAVGDSQTEGSPNNTISWPMATRKVLRRLGYPNVQIANAGCSGQKRDVTSSIFQSMAAKTRPDIAIFWNESVNSGGDFPTGQQFKFLASDIEFCRANGIKPVVVTQHLSTNSAAGIAETNRTRAFVADTGVQLFDFATVLATSPTLVTVNPAYVLPDGRHHTADGVAVLAEYVAPLLIGML